MSRKGMPLLVLLPVILVACHLAIGLEKKDLPEKASTPCSGSEDCDDGHGCTQDLCELPEGICRHYVLPDGTLCREKTPDNVCDIDSEYCDGTELDCPEDALEPDTVECRPSTGPCDEAEYCTGSDPACPEDGFSGAGTGCDDEDDCTYDDMCDGAGACAGTNGLYDGERIYTGPWAHFTCAGLSTNELRCWGNNIYGQLGDGTTVNRDIPVVVEELPHGGQISAFSGGGRHVCALLVSGRILCWGLGGDGQLGDGIADGSHIAFTPVEVTGTPDGWRQVSGGYLYTCGIQESDTAYCWGKNDHGQLGTGTNDDSAVPIVVTGLGGLSSIKGGCYHTCGIDLSGTLICWGRNTHGQLGNSTAGEYSLTPVAVEGISERTTAVVLGTLHTCALLESGRVMCWGENEFGQLGIGEGPGSPVPVEVTGIPGAARAIASAYEHTCVLLDGGGMMCWGHNDEGQIGDGTIGGNKVLPTSVEGLPMGVVSMGAGAFHTCAVLEDTSLRCWGHNVYGELGDGNMPVASAEPVVVHCN